MTRLCVQWKGEVVLRPEEKAISIWDRVWGREFNRHAENKREAWTALEVPEGQKNGQRHCTKAINEFKTDIHIALITCPILSLLSYMDPVGFFEIY